MLKNVIGRHAADSTRVSPPFAEGPEITPPSVAPTLG
jgi:hypothetical protein